MLARGLRIATVVLVAAALLGAGWLVAQGWPLLFALLVVAGLLLAVHALPLAIEFVTGALIDRRPGPRLSPLAALRLWLGEVVTQSRVFMIDQPWRSGFAEPAIVRDPARPAVLLVHGYLCNRAVWRPWLAPLTQGRNVATVNLEPPLGSIGEYAAAIAAAVDSLRAASGAPRVVLVCHSMGGLAAREYLRVHGGAAISSLITIATPHHGTVFAPLGLGRNTREMRRGSAFLKRLAAVPCPVPVTCLASRDDNLVVPRSSPVLEGARCSWFEQVGHLALTRHAPALTEVQALIDQKKPSQGA